MKIIKILDWPEKRFYSETHPFFKWKKQFKEHGIHIEFYHQHLHKNFKDADFVLLHSRYFDKGKNINNNGRNDDDELVEYLTTLKKSCAKLIWFDASDSSGSTDFSIIPYVDIFLKKQILKDKAYYSQQIPNKLRVWLNTDENETQHFFEPCPPNELHKIKLGWNLGLNDYRYFGYKLSRLSNYLNYKWYPLKFSKVTHQRTLDLTFRGSIHKSKDGSDKISEQRNFILHLLPQLSLNITCGKAVPKPTYWQELRNSKIAISPYGWGEICYRDFESFIAGALLIKPDMSHLITYPDMFKPYETYIPVDWDLNTLEETLDKMLSQPRYYQQIAQNGQDNYQQIISNSELFISNIISALEIDK